MHPKVSIGWEGLIWGKSAWQVMQYSGCPVSVGINFTGLGSREFIHQTRTRVSGKRPEAKASDFFIITE
jgi:hypothetical protein